MTETHGTGAGRPADPVRGATAVHEPAAETGATGSSHHPAIDWEAAERSPEFQELVRRRRAFVIPATVFFLAWYFGFIILAGYAPDFMGETFIVDGLTVGYTLALSQFVMTWGLAAWYLRKANRVFDPLAERAAERALEAGRAAAVSGRAPRFEREAAADRETSPEVKQR
jgi:uncharacterized membrane protein (DUF485 family)